MDPDTRAELRNLGPKSRAWLASVGVRTIDDLRRVGAVPAFVEVKRTQRGVSLNLLYALVGAVDGVDWLDVKRERRLELLMQLEDHLRNGRRDGVSATTDAPRGSG